MESSNNNNGASSSKKTEAPVQKLVPLDKKLTKVFFEHCLEITKEMLKEIRPLASKCGQKVDSTLCEAIEEERRLEKVLDQESFQKYQKKKSQTTYQEKQFKDVMDIKQILRDRSKRLMEKYIEKVESKYSMDTEPPKQDLEEKEISLTEDQVSLLFVYSQFKTEEHGTQILKYLVCISTVKVLRDTLIDDIAKNEELLKSHKGHRPWEYMLKYIDEKFSNVYKRLYKPYFEDNAQNFHEWCGHPNKESYAATFDWDISGLFKELTRLFESFQEIVKKLS